MASLRKFLDQEDPSDPDNWDKYRQSVWDTVSLDVVAPVVMDLPDLTAPPSLGISSTLSIGGTYGVGSGSTLGALPSIAPIQPVVPPVPVAEGDYFSVGADGKISNYRPIAADPFSALYSALNEDADDPNRAVIPPLWEGVRFWGEWFRDTPGYHYGQEHLQRAREEQVASLGEYPLAPTNAEGHVLNPFEEFAKNYELNNAKPGQLSNVQTDAGGAFFGALGAWAGYAGAVTGHEIMKSPVGTVVNEAQYRMGMLDDWAAAPNPALWGYSPVEVVYGPAEAWNQYEKNFDTANAFRSDYGQQLPADVSQRVAAVRSQYGQAAAEEVLANYYQQQTDAFAQSQTIPGAVQQLGSLAGMVGEYAQTIPSTYDAMKQARNPYTYGVFGSDYPEMNQVGMASYGVVDPVTGQSMGIIDSYGAFMDWAINRDARADAMRADADKLNSLASSKTDLGLDPKELSYNATLLNTQADELQNMGASDWIDQNVSVTQRLGYNLMFDWTEAAGALGAFLFGSGKLMRAQQAARGVIGVNAVDAVDNLAAGMARGATHNLADDGLQTMHGGFMPYAFDPVDRAFYPEMSRATAPAPVPSEFRSVDLDAAYNVGVSWEDDLLESASFASPARRVGDPSVASDLTRAQSYLHSGSTTVPAELSGLNLPPGLFDDAAWASRDSESLSRLQSYLKRTWADFEYSGSNPVFDAGDILARVAEQSGPTGYAGGFTSEAERLLGLAGAGQSASVEIPAELLGNQQQLWESISQTQALASRMGFVVTSTPGQILEGGSLSFSRIGGDSVDAILGSGSTSQFEMLSSIQQRLAGYSGNLTPAQRLEIRQLNYMNSVLSGGDNTWEGVSSVLGRSPTDALPLTVSREFQRFSSLANDVGVNVNIEVLGQGPIEAISQPLFVPSASSYDAFNRRVTAADQTLRDATRAEYGAWRSDLPRRADDFTAAGWLFDQFSQNSSAAGGSFTGTIDDLETLRSADRLMESSGFGYYVDWDNVRRGPDGYSVGFVPGQPQQSTTMRSASPWLDELYTRSVGTQHPSMLDISTRQYAPELIDTLESGGTGIYLSAAGGYQADDALRQMQSVAAQADLRVDMLDMTDGGFTYSLSPLEQAQSTYIPSERNYGGSGALSGWDDTARGSSVTTYNLFSEQDDVVARRDRFGKRYYPGEYFDYRDEVLGPGVFGPTSPPNTFGSVRPAPPDVTSPGLVGNPLPDRNIPFDYLAPEPRPRTTFPSTSSYFDYREQIVGENVFGPVPPPVRPLNFDALPTRFQKGERPPVLPVDQLLAQPVADDVVYVSPAEFTWKVNARGEMSLYPQSTRVWDSELGKYRYEAGFSFYSDPAQAVRGTRYEEMFGNPVTANMRSSSRPGYSSAAWQGTEVPALDDIDFSLDQSRNIGVDPTVYDVQASNYDNPIDVGGIEDLYWFEPAPEQLPVSRPQPAVNPVVGRENLPMYTQAGQRGSYYADNITGYRSLWESGDVIPGTGTATDVGYWNVQRGLGDGVQGPVRARDDVRVGAEYPAIERALNDNPLIAIQRSRLESVIAANADQFPDGWSISHSGEGGITFRARPSGNRDALHLPAASFAVGGMTPAALPDPLVGITTGYGSWVSENYRKSMSIAQDNFPDSASYFGHRNYTLGQGIEGPAPMPFQIAPDAAYELYRNRVVGPGMAGPASMPAGVDDLSHLPFTELLPKGVNPLPLADPTAVTPFIPGNMLSNSAMTGEAWQPVARATGVWYTPAKESWKGQVPWWLQSYGNQYHAPTNEGYEQMLRSLLQLGDTDAVPQALLDNPGLLNDYQALAGTAMGYDVSKWDLDTLNMSASDLDPTAWPSVGRVRGNDWAEQIPLNVRERLQNEWVNRISREGDVPFSPPTNWLSESNTTDYGYHLYRDREMGRNVQGPVPYNPILDAERGMQLDIDAMKAAAVAGDDVSTHRNFWQSVREGIGNVAPAWMDDTFTRVQDAVAGFQKHVDDLADLDRYVEQGEPLWSRAGGGFTPRSRRVGGLVDDSDELVTMHGGLGIPPGAPADYRNASRTYEMIDSLADFGFVSWEDALKAGRTDLLETELRQRLIPGVLAGGPVGHGVTSEFGYDQTFLQRMNASSSEIASWTGTANMSTNKVRPSAAMAAADAPLASFVPDSPLKISTATGRDGVTFASERDAVAFAQWMDTSANQIPMSFYGPGLGSESIDLGAGGITQVSVSTAQRENLYGLGYTDAEIGSMTDSDAHWLITHGKRKSGTNARRTDGPTGWVMEERRGQMSQAAPPAGGSIPPDDVPPVDDFGDVPFPEDSPFFSDDSVPYSPGQQATWTNADYDQPVVITGILGEHEGVRYYSIEGSTTGIPESELSAIPEPAPVFPPVVTYSPVEPLPYVPRAADPPGGSSRVPLWEEMDALNQQSVAGGGGAVPPAGGAAVPPGGAVPPSGVIPPGSGPAAGSAPSGTPRTNIPLLYGPLPAPPVPGGGRMGEYGQWWQDVLPLADSRRTRVQRATERMDIFGTVLASSGGGADDMAVLIDQFAQDPTALITGIDGSLLPGLANQLDGSGQFRIGPGVLGNRQIADVMPILDYAREDLVTFARELSGGAYGDSLNFNAFKERWTDIFRDASTQYFGTGIGDNPAWRALQTAGDIQRSILAEATLSLSPPVWAANAIGANYAAATEGYSTFRTTEDLVGALDQRVGGVLTQSGPASAAGVTMPTMRTAGAVEGKVVGSGAYLGLESNSILFRPRRWADTAIDATMGWWASDEMLERVDNALDNFAARFQRPAGPVAHSKYYVDPVAASGGYDAYRNRLVGAGLEGPAPIYNPINDGIDLLSMPGGYDAYRDLEVGAGIAGPAPASVGGADGYESYRDLFLGQQGGQKFEGPAPYPGTPAAAMSGSGLVVPSTGFRRDGSPATPVGFRPFLEQWNPFAPLATMSESASNIWTGTTTIAGGRVGFGEQANYLRTFAKADEESRRLLFNQAFDPVFEAGFERFGRDDIVMQSLASDYMQGKIMSSGRSEIADSASAILEGLVDEADASYPLYRDFVANDMLGRFDEFNYSSLTAAQAGADNVMLNPSHRTNLDEWLSPFFAFAYFGMHNAANWAERSLREPTTLRNFMLWNRMAGIENENEDVPTRYEGTLPGPGGVRVPNPFNLLAGGGIARLAFNEIGVDKMQEATNPGEFIAGAGSALNLRLLPGWEAAMTESTMSDAVADTFWQLRAIDQGARALGLPGMGLTTDEFTNFRASRELGADTIMGEYTPATGVMGQQSLYQDEWGTPESPYVAAAGEQAAQDALRSVAGEEFFGTLVRGLLSPLGIKAPINPGELEAARLSAEMQAVGPNSEYGTWDNNKYFEGQNLSWQAWGARNSLWPLDQIGVPNEPITRLEKAMGPVPMPTQPSLPAPDGWQPPQFDLEWGRRIKGPDDSLLSEKGDTTALYTLRDPLTGDFRYIGQSIHPSERYKQHLEQFTTDGFEHPKTKWEASLYAQGSYPEMYVFDWATGTVPDSDDEADKLENLWIGYFRYVRGADDVVDVNKKVPSREEWEQLLEEFGETPESMTAQFEQWPSGLEPVRLDGEPNIPWDERSPFPGDPVTGEDILAAEAAGPVELPEGTADFATWIKGLGEGTQAKLREQGIYSWQDLANVGQDEQWASNLARDIGVSPGKVAEWAAVADKTIKIQQGVLPMELAQQQPDNSLYLPYVASNAQPGSTAASGSQSLASILAGQGGAQSGTDLPYAPPGDQLPSGAPAAFGQLLGGLQGWWQNTGGRTLERLFRLGQAAGTQTTDIIRSAQRYREVVERSPGGEPVGAGAQTSKKYYYLPGWGPSVNRGEEFFLPELPDGGEWWLPRNMIKYRDEDGTPDPDYVNNPGYDRTQPGSLQRMLEVYGPLQEVPVQWLASEPAYYGPGGHSSYEQPRVVAGGRKGLQGDPYGVNGAGGMHTTIGAPDPRTQPELYAQWQQAVTEPRGEYGIWLDSPLGGSPALTQGYGENPDAYARFGLAGHNGLDWSTKEGTDVFSAAPGQVSTVGYDEGGWGNYVMLQHDWGSTLYAHLSGVGVEEGQWLATGDLLGLSGSTGNSSGPHLHFEMIMPDGPDEYGGRVDPTPYLPGYGDASDIPGGEGWMLTDISGIGSQMAANLVDAGITNPGQLAGVLPLPGMDRPGTPAEIAHWVDVNVLNAEGNDAVSPQQGWNFVTGARALLQTGPKPVKVSAGNGASGFQSGIVREGDSPLAPGIVSGLGPATIEKLAEYGITTFEQLSGARSGMTDAEWVVELSKLPDIGEKTARDLAQGASSAVRSGVARQSVVGGPPAAKPSDRPLVPGVVPGVGEETIKKLAALDTPITTVEQLKGTSPAFLAKNVEGWGETKAINAVLEAEKVAETPWDGRPAWSSLPHIGAQSEKALYEAGVDSAKAMLGMSPKRLAGMVSGMDVDEAREAINAFRAQQGLGALTPEEELKLEGAEPATPDDFEFLTGVGKKTEQRLYDAGITSVGALYEMSFDDIKTAMKLSDREALVVVNELLSLAGGKPYASIEEAKKAMAPEPGTQTDLGTYGLTSAQVKMLSSDLDVQTQNDFLGKDDQVLADALGITLPYVQNMKELIRKEQAAQGEEFFDPEDVPAAPSTQPYSAKSTREPIQEVSERAAGIANWLRPKEKAVKESDIEEKPDKRLDLGDTVDALERQTEDPGKKAVSVSKAKKAPAADTETPRRSSVFTDREEEMLEKLRSRVVREVFSEFEKVLAV